MNFADTVDIYKYQRFGANILEIGPFLLELLRNYGDFNGPENSVKNAKNMPCS